MNLKTLTAALAGACAMGAIATAQEDPAQTMLQNLNEQMVAMGFNIEIEKIELIGSGEGMAMGRTVINAARDKGNKQLSTDWSPMDPNRGGRTNITYAIDTADATADFPASEQPDVVRFGIETWDEQTCSDIGLDELPAPAADLGFVQFLVGFGGSPITATGDYDLVHGGFLPASFFDAIGGPGGGTGILGVNFTFTWTGGQDSDGNGRNDVALKESYYNDGFNWVNDGRGERSDRNAAGERIFDFATVALHESGHGLARAHFGDVAILDTPGTGAVLKTNPAAVMNAIYGGVKRELLGPDVGGHCSDWSAWPIEN